MRLKAGAYFLLVFTLAWFCQAAISQAAPLRQAIRLTLKDLGSGDLSLTGMHGTASVWVPFQSDWLLEEAIKVQVAYVASPLLHQQRSTLTVLANDLEVTSIHPLADGQAHTFSFAIPVKQLQGRGILLRFQGYLRLTDLPCEETNNAGQWLTILNQTSLELRPTLNRRAPDLSDLPEAIVVQNALAGPPPVIFVLPDNPDPVALTTAAQVAARLGQTTRGDLFPFQAATPGTLTPAQRQEAHLVVVGLPADQPLIKEMAAALPAGLAGTGFTTADNLVAPPEHGVIQIFNSPWNEARRVLLVSAGQEAGLQLAGQAFADRPTFQALHDSFSFVRAPEIAAAPVPGPAWTTARTTFAQLGEQNRTVRGTGLFNEYYYFRRPPGWVLDNGSQLTLHLAFSPALQASESYVAAFINEVHVGTARIGQGIAVTQATFDLPIALLNETPRGERPQELTLHLVVANFLQENGCQQAHPEAAWTQILADSYFVTPHVYLALPDLQAFPYPFVGDQPDAPVVLATPPQPEPFEVGLALSLAASLGHFAPADFDLQLLPADQVSMTTHGQAHLIILGERSRQPLLAEFLDRMGAIPGYRGEEGLYQALRRYDSGLLREGPSPWNAQRVALLVFGDTRAGFERAAMALLKAAPPVAQPGSAALVEAGQPPRLIYRSIAAPPGPEPGEVLREPLIPQPPPWAVITITLAIATLAVLGLIWFSRYRAARQRVE